MAYLIDMAIDMAYLINMAIDMALIDMACPTIFQISRNVIDLVESPCAAFHRVALTSRSARLIFVHVGVFVKKPKVPSPA